MEKNLAYWEKCARECGVTENISENAIGRMAIRGLVVTAEEADRALGLSEGTTYFLFHQSTIPAKLVDEEFENRASANRVQ